MSPSSVDVATEPSTNDDPGELGGDSKNREADDDELLEFKYSSMVSYYGDWILPFVEGGRPPSGYISIGERQFLLSFDLTKWKTGLWQL